MRCEVIFDVGELKKNIEEIELALSKEETWSSPEKVQEMKKRQSRIMEKVAPFEAAEGKLKYLEESVGILEEEGGEVFGKEIAKDIEKLKKSLSDIELKNLLSGKMDASNAIVTIHPGAGGTESQDWAQMLSRIYLRWAELKGYNTQVLDLLPGEEAGIKSITFSVNGPYAYGYLKEEAGVHRLVRISPFDANKRRHTSFSAVLVYPEIKDDISIEIKDEELKIDTFRASGAGGQHVNKTSSAVRITHIPSGIVVSCQNERSQHRNKEVAMKILKSRLYDIKMKEHEKKIEGLMGDKKDIAWGSQIRSYVLQPYRLVKDHRTGIETGNVDSVLDGNIDIFIEASLKKKFSATSISL
jgi:peptide chain release factor 2